MNYYRRYIGDFQADTMALSMMEQGAYDRMLDHYYGTERPLPLNTDRVAIICRAVTMEERAAAQLVLETYFERTDAGWVHHRVEKELALSRSRSGAGKLGAESRWDGKEDGKPDGKTHGKLHAESMQIGCSPTTNHQPPESKPLCPAFVRFWEAWPASKRKLDKARCAEHWQRERLATLADEIVAHVQAMKAAPQWLEGYEPAPLKYLKNRRWEDPLPEAPKRGLAI